MSNKITTPPQEIRNFPYDESEFRKIVQAMTYADIFDICIEVWAEKAGIELLRSELSPSEFSKLEGEASHMIFTGPKTSMEKLFARVG